MTAAKVPPTTKRALVLNPEDLRKYFTIPRPDELLIIDACCVQCMECGAEWEVVLLHHGFTRGTVNSLIAHAMSHQPGQPGMRRIS